MNPLHLEYKRSQRTALLLVLLLALSAAAVDYFWGLQQRLSQRQAMLYSATEDLEHQLTPMLELLQLLQQEAVQQLALDAPTSPASPLPGAQWSLDKTQQKQLSSTELQMLQQLQPLLLFSQRSVAGVRQLSYLSANSVWYQPQTQRSGTAEALSELYWQQFQPQQLLTMPQVRLHKLQTQPASYVLSIAIFHQQQWQGEFLLEFDLPLLLQKTARAQQGAQLQLFNESGDLLLAVSNGELLSVPTQVQPMHHSDQLKMLTVLPLSLHIEAEQYQTFSIEMVDFIVHFFLFLLVLLLLLAYCRRRYRAKVLSPFQRLLVHIDRLLRGDAQGVRNVPVEWQPLFRQVEQLKPEQQDQNNR
jgi:hypothetical protein